MFADPFAAQPGWELVPWMIAEQTGPPIDPLGADAVMTFGGAMHADQEDAHRWLADEKQLLSELLDAARAGARGMSRRAAAGRGRRRGAASGACARNRLVRRPGHAGDAPGTR